MCHLMHPINVWLALCAQNAQKVTCKIQGVKQCLNAKLVICDADDTKHLLIVFMFFVLLIALTQSWRYNFTCNLMQPLFAGADKTAN